jgi:hypothetical protein
MYLETFHKAISAGDSNSILYSLFFILYSLALIYTLYSIISLPPDTTYRNYP